MSTMAFSPTITKNLIVDTDVGFDDIIALHLLRSKIPKNTSYGAQCAHQIFGLRDNIPVAAGDDVIHADDEHSWLPSYHQQFRDYMEANYDKNDARGAASSETTTEAVREVLNSCDDGSCDLLCLGPLTNIAKWLREEDLSILLCEKISFVYILGGTQSQVGTEFNFMCDSAAASTVLSSPTFAGKIKLVTADVSGSSSPSKFSEGLAEKVNNLLASIPANASSSKEIISILDLLRRHPNAIFYDPVCAFAYIHSEKVTWTDCVISNVDGKGTLAFTPCGNDAKHQKASVSILNQLDEAHQRIFVNNLLLILNPTLHSYMLCLQYYILLCLSMHTFVPPYCIYICIIDNLCL